MFSIRFNVTVAVSRLCQRHLYNVVVYKKERVFITCSSFIEDTLMICLGKCQPERKKTLKHLKGCFVKLYKIFLT